MSLDIKEHKVVRFSSFSELSEDELQFIKKDTIENINMFCKDSFQTEHTEDRFTNSITNLNTVFGEHSNFSVNFIKIIDLDFGIKDHDYPNMAENFYLNMYKLYVVDKFLMPSLEEVKI